MYPRVGRAVLRGFVAAAAAVLLVSAQCSSAHAEPTPAEVERQLDKAWEQLEPLIEQYNKVHSELLANQQKSADLTERIRPLQQQIDQEVGRIGEFAARQYKLGPATGLNAMLSGGSPQTFIDQLATLDHIARATRDQIATTAALRDKYDADRRAIDTLVAQQKLQDTDLAAKKNVIQAEIDRLQRLRNQLGAAAPSASSLYIGTCPAVYPGGAAAIAVKTACAQIGKPYVWGAGGPGSFDCSGLTQYAWKAAGVSLTHYTGAQWNQGAPVSRANLRPGDLVFFYSDLHHVGMYVGNGLMVHASRSGVPVKMARIDGMPYMGARRPG